MPLGSSLEGVHAIRRRVGARDHERPGLSVALVGEEREFGVEIDRSAHHRKSRCLTAAGGDAHCCGFLRGSGDPIALGPNGARRRHDPVAARSDCPEGHRVTITAEPTAHTVDRDRAIDTRHHVHHEPRSTGRAGAMIEGIEGERVDRVEWGGKQLAHETRPYRDRVVNACGQAARNPRAIHMKFPFRSHATFSRVRVAVAVGSIRMVVARRLGVSRTLLLGGPTPRGCGEAACQCCPLTQVDPPVTAVQAARRQTRPLSGVADLGAESC